jgi:hypothetical protein
MQDFVNVGIGAGDAPFLNVIREDSFLSENTFNEETKYAVDEVMLGRW